jgi:hypothetical protein
MAIPITSQQVTELIEGLERYLTDLQMIPATGLYRNRVVLALLSKALTVGRAVCVLVDAGFTAEAFGLSRTIVEICLTVRFIGNMNTESRAASYVEYVAKLNETLMQIHAKYYPTQKIKMPHHDEMMRIAGKFPSKHHWTGIRGQARFMAVESDTTEVDEYGKPLNSEYDYDVVYFETSQLVHATIPALEGHLSEHREVFRVWSRKDSDEKYRGKALFNVLLFLSKAFIYGCRVMHEDQPTVLEDSGKLMRACADAADPEGALREAIDSDEGVTRGDVGDPPSNS